MFKQINFQCFMNLDQITFCKSIPRLGLTDPQLVLKNIVPLYIEKTLLVTSRNH